MRRIHRAATTRTYPTDVLVQLLTFVCCPDDHDDRQRWRAAARRRRGGGAGVARALPRVPAAEEGAGH